MALMVTCDWPLSCTASLMSGFKIEIVHCQFWTSAKECAAFIVCVCEVA